MFTGFKIDLLILCVDYSYRTYSGYIEAVKTWLHTPFIEFISEYEALGMDQWSILPLVQQEISEVQSGKNTAIGRVLDEHSIQLWPS